MGLFQDVVLGFQACLQPTTLLYCFIGVLVGTLVGVLPGIGPGGTMAILLPITFNAPPLASVVMLAGIYYGAMYGGSTTSILVNIPGEAASVMTCLDGYQMALQGRAGPALGISAFGSFIAGTIGVFALMLLARPLASFTLEFGPPEYFGVMILAIIILVYVAQKSVIKAIAMGTAGLILSYVGLDVISGQERFTLNVDSLVEGIGIVPMLMGLLGMAEILEGLEETVEGSLLKTSIKGILPSMKDWADSIGAIMRGTILGFFLGVLPGGGATLSSFLSYSVEKKLSKHPETFGSGAIEGVAGPESANNAAASGAFVPLLTLGIPSNGVMAMLFAGLLIHNIAPGPLMLQEHPDVFWGVITSMYIGNLMLLGLNLPLIGLWVQITKIPFRLLFPAIVFFCLIGVYSVNNSVFDIGLMVVFSAVGYIMKKCDYEPAPLVMAFILGPRIERSMRQSLIMSDGSFSIFLFRPISGVCLAVGALLLMVALWRFLKEKKT